MAQRQYLRKIRTGGVRFEDVYRAISEYRSAYPDKAIIYSAQKHPEMGWAALMAGGSCTAIPVKDEAFLKSLSSMKPRKTDDALLLEGADGMVVYKLADKKFLPTLKDTYQLYQIDEKTGEITKLRRIKAPATIEGKGVFWLRKK